MEMISLLEKEIGLEAMRNLLPMQPGDVYATFADIEDLTALTGFKPSTSLLKTVFIVLLYGIKEYYKVWTLDSSGSCHLWYGRNGLTDFKQVSRIPEYE